ncbi:MAG: phage tail protein [Lachnospiraceae bacterium]|nr:phage tail protein [Lachnospiraceae bacterium]
MALGGGTFSVQNKTIPGAYINFVSAASADISLSGRGIATMPLNLEWGEDGKVIEVTNDDFKNNSQKIFGYHYTHPKMKGLRDLFRNVELLYAYRLNGGGSKAGNTYATAVYSGTRGNDLKIIIQKNVDDDTLFDVKTMLDTALVDEQVVKVAAELKANGYVEFKADAELAVTASTPLAGGTDGETDGASHQAYLDKIEGYSFNALGVDATDDTIKALYAAFTERMREDMGLKFQTVLYQKAADYYGVVNVVNEVSDSSEASLVYWVTGVIAGCQVNKSNQNKVYDGEFTVETEATQTQLANALKEGKFTLHRVGSEVRVLADINSKVSETEDCGAVFKENQTIRVIDQIANDIAVLFNTKYLGVVPNDNAGRISLWSDIVQHHKKLNDIRAIEGFEEADVVVSQGDSKKSVVVSDAVTVVNSMDKLYMTVTVS